MIESRQYLSVYHKDVKGSRLPSAPQHVDQVLHHTEITTLNEIKRREERQRDRKRVRERRGRERVRERRATFIAQFRPN